MSSRADDTTRPTPDRASATTPSRPHQPATENDATTDSRARGRPGALGRRWVEVARAHRRHRAAGAGRLSQLRRSRDWGLGHLAGGDWTGGFWVGEPWLACRATGSQRYALLAARWC